MKTVEGRVKAILAAVEGLLARRAAKYEDGHEPFVGLKPPTNTKAYRKQVAKAKASFSRDSVLQRIAADERRIEEINARLPSR